MGGAWPLGTLGTGLCCFQMAQSGVGIHRGRGEKKLLWHGGA